MSADMLYPLPATREDSRFTFGLLIDITEVLTRHGYPKPASGRDLLHWQQALYRGLYHPVLHDPEGHRHP